MKIFKILVCLMFVFAISACHDKKTTYDYPDEDPTTAEKGNVGDPCQKNPDCKEGLFCIDKVCSEPVEDEDQINDPDENPENDEDISDTEPTDDSDTDTNVPDTNPTDDSDTAVPDKDEPEDTDTQPDEDADIPDYTQECGNGIRDQGEECDNGAENSDEPGIPGITCRTDCLFARCRDGIVDSGERCDDGNASTGDYCSPDCQTITGYCGDGVQQTNENCDPVIEPYCADDCSGIAGYCGDGIKQPHEKCDNAEPGEGGGEGIGPYYCSIDCQGIMGSCGDGRLQENEACDDGSKNGRYGYCNATCSGDGPKCGDGKTDLGHEACDDGNTLDGDYCSADCQTSNGRCGDGIKQDFEVCDNATYGEGKGLYCDDDCQTDHGTCGDGVIYEEAGEECDDGGSNNLIYCPYSINMTTCTLCSASCHPKEGIPRYCGDGVVSNLAGEECDKANFGDGTGPYYCSDDCMKVIGSCGDGVKQPNEACDPGLDPYCSSDCKKSEGECGDGTRNGSEECDNGADNGKTDCEYGLTSCKVCTTSCTETDGKAHYCGNESLDQGEECDDGNENGNYGKCNSDCSGPGKHCGDGNIDSENGEVCDNGADNGKKDCEYGLTSCKVCTTSCTETDGTAAYCGDGKLNRENCDGYENCVVTAGVNETCDDGINDGQYGHCLPGCYGAGQRCGDGEVNGSEKCDDGDEENGNYGKCKTDCSGPGERCGDGTIQTEHGEVCDDGEDNGTYSLNAPGHCNSDCKGYGEGGICGDGTQQPEEACDRGEDLNGRESCAYGQTSCEVCSTRCTLTAGKTAYCGDGHRDSDYEECDRGAENADYNAPCNTECSGVPPKCGDGNIDETFGETCDDGEDNGTYLFEQPGSCNSNCQGQGEGGWCGDGTQNGGESCDAGILNNGAYGGLCDTTCSGSPTYCGDGKIQSRALCTADDETLEANGYLNQNDFLLQNGFNDVEACLAQLTDANEVCDEGDGLNGTYGHCNSECSAILKCGDGIIQSGNGEECDSGDANGTTDQCAYNETSCKLCNAQCKEFNGQTSYCGDGIVDEDVEDCDDGEENGSYGNCKSDCSGPMPKCGDGNVDGIYGEVCDEGSDLNGTYGHCSSGCRGISECGDGIQQAEEACDNGEPFNGTYGNCRSDCSGITGYCQDGILQKAACGGEEGCIEIPGANEQCDNGADNGNTKCNYGETSCYVCTTSCQLTSGTEISYCGDGNVDGIHGELCDDGELNGTFGKCDERCLETVTWRCGDGNPDFAHGETCDDSDGVNGTYILEKPGTCNSDCKERGAGGFCGDGIIQSEHGETCDDGENNNTQGFCNSTCNGQTPVCGNGIVDAGEFCDDGENKNKYGKCNDDCSGYGTSGYCGDGIVQKSTDAECTEYIAEDPVNRKLCDETITTNCCKVVEFAAGDASEACDDGDDNGLSHDHCNQLCSGISYCGDGLVGKDEVCERICVSYAEDPNDCLLYAANFAASVYKNCSLFPQFSSGEVTECNSECMPVLTSCVNNDAYRSPFFNTNQTICYDNSDDITCPAEAEDFYGQSPQFLYLEQDFEVNGGITSEAVSNTEWQTETPATYEGCAAGDSCTYDEAVNYCSNLGLGGYDDWRLPSAFDFPIIADFEATPHIRSEFTDTKNDIYWTAEGLAFSAVNGTMTGGHSTAQVKCVRKAGEESCPVCGNDLEMFEYSASLITVFNKTAIVIWHFGNPMTSDTWQQALDTCKNININGINRMRLPTASELISLIDATNGGSLIPGFAERAWTSTTLSGSPENNAKAYVVDFSTLSLVTDDKTNSNYIICVE
ncbi:DUF1566 domain-containing protein [bacterium]|nr:DUF1566 domain-containing protein [bacterium]